MPLLQKHNAPLWAIWKIEENWEELLRQLERPEAYLSILNGYKSEGRKSEWLAVRVLLKELTGCEPDILYHDNGAPYLQESSSYISISHTKGFAAVLLSPNKPVGIDIEYHSERIYRIKSRFLSETEFELLGENPSTDKLLTCWSAKETVFKMLEQKTADMQKDIQIIDCNLSHNNGMIMLKESLTPHLSVFQIEYMITPDFVVTHSK